MSLRRVRYGSYNNKRLTFGTMIYEFLATGFEEVEALAPVDILRRGGVEIKTVSVTGDLLVESAHGVAIKADLLFEDADLASADLLLLPGGLPGAGRLPGISAESSGRGPFPRVGEGDGLSVGGLCGPWPDVALPERGQ